MFPPENRQFTGYAVLDKRLLHGPIVLRLFNSLETGMGDAAYSRKLLNYMGNSGLDFLGQRKLWIMFPRSWIEVSQARTFSWKVTCNFPVCKSRKSILGNHANDHFGLKESFFWIAIILFLFLNYCVLHTEYILYSPHVPSPSPSHYFFVFQSHFYSPVIYTHDFMHLYKI